MANKILFIDDSDETLELVQTILEDNGYKVVTARNGIEGLEKAKEEKPVVIIVDVLMPQMNGFEFFKEAIKDEDLSQIPIIILTARAKMEDSFMAIGAHNFLAKPLDATELLSAVEKAVNRGMAHDTGIPEEQEFLSAEKRPQQKKAPEKEKKGLYHDTSIVDDNLEATAGKKKAVVFGQSQQTLDEIKTVLEKEDCIVTIIREEYAIFSSVEKYRPDLILLQINSETQVPFDEIVINLSALIEKKVKDVNLDDYDVDNFSMGKVFILLYSSDEQASGVVSEKERMGF